MSIEGVSRVSVGETTDTGYAAKLNVVVSASTTTGIGSTVFEGLLDSDLLILDLDLDVVINSNQLV